MASLRRLLTLTALAVVAANGQTAAPPVSLADVSQTMQACKRLQEDEQLATLNIGVRVRGRVAVLWGPAPTAELALRVEQRLRQMIELIEVRNELIVVPEDLRDVPVPVAPPLFLPEKSPPPLPDAPRRFLRRDLDGAAAELVLVVWDFVQAWDAASAKR